MQHDGIWPGFLSQMVVAPDDGVGVLAFANTGTLSGQGAPVPLGFALMREALGLPEDAVRSDLPERPEAWSDVCGWYSPGPGALAALPVRAVLGGAVQVAVRRGRLVIRGPSPVPALRRGLRLHPDDADDPYAFRIDLTGFGLGTSPIVFSRRAGGAATALHMGVAPVSLRRVGA